MGIHTYRRSRNDLDDMMTNREILTRMLGLDWVRTEDEYNAAIKSLASPGTLVMIPPKFTCHACGSGFSRHVNGIYECSWCDGTGRHGGRR